MMIANLELVTSLGKDFGAETEEVGLNGLNLANVRSYGSSIR